MVPTDPRHTDVELDAMIRNIDAAAHTTKYDAETA